MKKIFKKLNKRMEEKMEDNNINLMTLYKLQKFVNVDEFSNLANTVRVDEQRFILESAIVEFMQGRISWGEFSTKFSYSAYKLNRDWHNCEFDIYSLRICENDCNIQELKTSAEPVAYRIHTAWLQAYRIAKRLTELGYELDGTNAEKIQSQSHLDCTYDKLSREEQLKDIYVFKGFYLNNPEITEPNAWEKYFSTEEIEKGFIKYNINW